MEQQKETFNQAIQMLKDNENPKYAIELLQQLANENYGPALLQLSICYQSGEVVELNEELAMEYLMRYSETTSASINYHDTQAKLTKYFDDESKEYTKEELLLFMIEAYEVLRWGAPIQVRQLCFQYLKKMVEKDMNEVY